MAQHLRYGGSSIGRVMLCRASATLSEKAPKSSPGPYAEEGTIAHSLLERALKDGLSDVSFLVGVDEEVTQDMAEAVNVALEYIAERACYGLANTTIVPEQFVRFPGYEAIAGGTADVQLILWEEDAFEIIDFKYGFDPVEADAPQLMFYAVAAFGMDTDVRCTVIQPRAFHEDGPVRSVDVTAARLRAFYDEAANAIDEAEAELPPYAPSIKACHYCPAAAMCPALEAEALSLPAARNLRELARTGCRLPAPSDMDMERVTSILRMRPLIEEWLNAVQHYAYDQAMAGASVPGYKLVEVRKNRSWPADKTVAQVASILADTSGLPLTDFIRDDLLPITKAQEKVAASLVDTGVPKRDAKKLAKDVLAFIVERKKSASLTLASADDKRPGVNRAARDFEGVTFNGETTSA